MTNFIEPRQTLYGITSELLGLCEYKQQIADDPDITPAEQIDILAAIDTQIGAYMKALDRKVDATAGFFRHCNANADALKKEARRCTERAKYFEQLFEEVESRIIAIMQERKLTKLEGGTSTLRLQKNPPSVEVAQPDLVPHEYQRVTVKMSLAQWNRLIQALSTTERNASLGVELLEQNQVTPEPIKTIIAGELKLGEAVPGCTLVTDKVHLVVK